MNINLQVIEGRLTRDPELVAVGEGKQLCKFSVACNGFKDTDTDFFEVTAWGKLADLCAQYLKKGSAVICQGRSRHERWQDKASGQNRSKHVLHADQVRFISGKEDAQEPQQGGYGYGDNEVQF